MAVTEIDRRPGPPAEDAYRARHAALVGAGELTGFVAEGGTGAVLRVSLREGEGELAKDAIVKVLRNDLLASPAAARRFRREVATARKVAGRFHSPRVVPLLGAVDSDRPELLHLLEPYYPDGSLCAFVRNGATVGEALSVLVDAVEGLQGLHGHGYVHRDFCPHNVLVVREGGRARGLLADLGASVPLGGSTELSGTEAARELELRIGHRGYVAPEGRGALGNDLFGVGATLYWLVAGAEPPVHEGPGPLRLPSLSLCRRGVGAALHRKAEKVVERLTAHLEDGAYRIAAEARAGLLALLDLLPSARGAAVASNPRRLRLRLAIGAAVVAAALSGAVAVRGTVSRTPAPTEPARALAPAVESEVAAARGRISRGEFAEAEAVLREALARAPAHPDVSGLLATLRSRAGQGGLAEAEGLLRPALAAHPERGDLRLALARVLAARGDATAAASVVAARPRATTHPRELSALAVTFPRAARRSR